MVYLSGSFVPRFAEHCSDLWTASLRVEDLSPSNCVRVSPRGIPGGFSTALAASLASLLGKVDDRPESSQDHRWRHRRAIPVPNQSPDHGVRN